MRIMFIIPSFLLLLTWNNSASLYPPYIYYYSDFLNAIVVERADGTDSRVLAQGVLDETESWISAYGPGWSPSGEWFAWTNHLLCSECSSRSYAGVVKADGTAFQFPMLLQDTALSWSPTDDILFVVDHDWLTTRAEGYYATIKNDFYLLDVEAGQILTSFTLDLLYSESLFHWGSWSPDGSFVQFSYEPYITDENSDSQTYPTSLPYWVTRTIYLDGRISDYQHPKGMIYNIDEWRMVSLNSPASWEFTLDDRQLSGKNAEIGEHFTLDMPTEYVGHLEWSPSGKYALFFNWQPDDTVAYDYSANELWLLSLEDRSLTLLTADAAGISDSYNLWSPAADQAVFSRADGSLAIYDAVLDSFTEIEVNATLDQFPYAHWSNDGTTLTIQHVLSSEGNSWETYRYDVATGTLSQIVVPAQRTIFPSPDERYTVTLNDHTIYHTGSGARIQTNFNSRATMGPLNYDWHFSGKWLFYQDHIMYAGGCCGPAVASVSNVEGTTQRELTLCRLGVHCIDWLPENVIPHLAPGQPTSVVQDPEYTLQFVEQPTNVEWSSDGNYLAICCTSTVENDEQQVTIWDFQTQAVLTRFNEISITWGTGYTGSGYYGGRYLTSPDGTLIAVEGSQADETGLVIIEAASRRVAFTVPDIEQGISEFYWTPQSDGLIIFRDGRIFIYELAINRTIRISDEQVRFEKIAYDPVRQIVAASSKFEFIHIWNLINGQEVAKINRFSFNAMDFSPDGRWLAATTGNTITIWDVDAAIATYESFHREG